MQPPSPKPPLLDRLLRLLDRLAIGLRLMLLIGLVVVTLGVVGLGIGKLVSANRVHHLKFAVGDPLGEGYILGQALEQVVESYYPQIQIEIVPTGGTAENLQQLEANQVQLATAQADYPAGPNTRSVVTLYRDLLQLVVKNQSGIQQFTDLMNKRIGVQPTGGQFFAFLEVARHYDLAPESFQFVGTSDDETGQAFQEDRVDAVFRVRAPGNPAILDLVQHDQGQLLPIEQAEAMKIKYPAFEPAVIPRGAYRGSLPVVPAKDIPTVAIQKLLLTNRRVDDTVMREITTILNEHRQEIANAIPDRWAEIRPLVASINRPSTPESSGIPLHPGALSYFDRNKPSFIRKNADYLTFLLTLTLLAGSWLWELKSWAEKSRKDLADGYVDQVIQLMGNRPAQPSPKTPEQRREALYALFDQAADDLVDEKISQESFRTFNEAYTTAKEKIEREIELADRQLQQTQQQKTASYIHQMSILMQTAGSKSPDDLHTELNRIFKQTLDDLIAGRISQESFRTFAEVYNTTRNSLMTGSP